ncbi:hypothetical protein Q8A67_018258 [Cirrhinus molitorella]|uniref:Transmembrane protein INAFM2 n=1 Tax=Cirrhinus molitorella TaxID=172907 RepID=A0AA88PCB8_9TELE|nr:hypothetical protein Q8A67_018258 [Cirrhinus molitorella]
MKPTNGTLSALREVQESSHLIQGICSRPLKAFEKNTLTAGNRRNIRHLRMRGDKPISTGRTNGGAERRPSYPGDQRVKHANRATKIWVKVAMGIAYFLCVSIAAFFLAIYYVLFWTPDGHNATKPNGSCLNG